MRRLDTRKSEILSPTSAVTTGLNSPGRGLNSPGLRQQQSLVMRKFNSLLLYNATSDFDPVDIMRGQGSQKPLYGEKGAQVEKFYIPKMPDEVKIAVAESQRIRTECLTAIYIAENSFDDIHDDTPVGHHRWSHLRHDAFRDDRYYQQWYRLLKPHEIDIMERLIEK